MNRVLCIMKDLESGVTLMKDPADKKDWTEKDLIRMRKKGVIKGYDADYNKNFVIMEMSTIQYMYLVGEEQCRELDAEDGPEAIEEEFNTKWAGSLPHGSGSKVGDVMFR